MACLQWIHAMSSLSDTLPFLYVGIEGERIGPCLFFMQGLRGKELGLAHHRVY